MTDKPTCIIKILDEVSVVLIGLKRLELEFFYEKFGYYAKSYFFNPKFKLGAWDGKIRFFGKNGKTYINLLPEILPYVRQLGYRFELKDQRKQISMEIPEIDKTYFEAHGIEIAPHQIEGINAFTKFHTGTLEMATGAGKAQPLHSKVLTPTGWQQMGDLKIDDFVLTPTNKKVKILGIFPQGETPVYKLNFDDNSSVESSDEHLWEINLQENNPNKITKKRYASHKEIVTTNKIVEILDAYNSFTSKSSRKNISVNINEVLDFDNNGEKLPIHPYLLGVILGDGGLTQNVIITSADDFIVNRINEVLPENTRINKLQDKYSYSIIKKEGKINPLKEQLKQYGLMGKKSSDKFIPKNYLFSSRDDRLELLKGLMDTDGTIGKRGQPSYCTVSEKLKDDFIFLAKSLGCNVRYTSKFPRFKSSSGEIKIGKKCYVIHIISRSNIFSLPRKSERFNFNNVINYQNVKKIISYEYMGKIKTQCILIDDPAHLYLTDGFTITHNTFVMGAICDLYNKHYGLKTLCIVPTVDLVVQGIADFQTLGLDVGVYSGDKKDLNHSHVISTWQSIINNYEMIKMFHVMIIDEAHEATGVSLQKILNEYGSSIIVRLGLTGTLPKAEADQETIKVLLGPRRYNIEAKELMDIGWLAQLNIRIYQLQENLKREFDEFEKKNPEEWIKMKYKDFKEEAFPDYFSEINYLNLKQSRNNFIFELVQTIRDNEKSNTLILVNNKNIAIKLSELIPNSIFIHGGDHKDIRKEAYASFADKDDLCLIATYKLASRGINIKRIFNLIIVDAGKGFTKVIQSIGRSLRTAHDKDAVTAYDICSDLKYSKRHLKARKGFYDEKHYNYTQKLIDYE